MGLVANLPIALAPGKHNLFDSCPNKIYILLLLAKQKHNQIELCTGMGMNAYFTYSVVGFRGTVS